MIGPTPTTVAATTTATATTTTTTTITTTIGAGCILALAVVSGLIAHEWSHAIVLRLAAVDYEIRYLPDRSERQRDGWGPNSVVALLRSCPWAAVAPKPTGTEPAWLFRLAALAPLCLALPVFGLGIGGYLTADTPIVAAAAIGWLACSIPSPQDFSIVFYAHRLTDPEGDDDGVLSRMIE